MSARRNNFTLFPSHFPLFTFVLVLLFSVSASAQGVPTLIGRVVDNAEILSPQTETTITLLLEIHEAETSNQVAVLTIPTLGGESVESYAIRVFRTWGLGRVDVNNGVLLLIAKNDRELRIEVGYGLEGSLTDAEAGRIIRNVIVPLFRVNDFEGGTLAGVTAIIGTIEGTYIHPKDGGGDGDEFPWWIGLIFLFSHGLLPMFVGIRALVNPPVGRYFTFVFTLFFIAPMVFIFGGLVFGEAGMRAGVGFMALYLLGYILADIYMRRTPKWQDIRKQVRAAQKKGEIAKIDAGWISFSAGGSSSSGGGGGFSGSGGSSGGGGASGSW